MRSLALRPRLSRAHAASAGPSSFRAVRAAAALALLFGSVIGGPLLLARPAAAQDFFIPGQPRAAAPSPRPAPSRRQSAPARVAPPQITAPAPDQGDADQQAVDAGQDNLQPALPPEPTLPPLPKGTTPPAAVIGVMGVPEVMRASSAARQIERAIGERRQKLGEDAQKEQAAWRDMQQALINDRTRLTPDQIRNRERELQERITRSQREFRERGRIVQMAAQYALAQVERTLVAVIRQVAESRGMNLVLHRQQVALNVNEFDITDAVAAQMNKVLPSVVIPPDGVMPPTLPADQTSSGTPTGTGTGASPASAPASGTATGGTSRKR